jgi:serine/threonine-protein kinase
MAIDQKIEQLFCKVALERQIVTEAQIEKARQRVEELAQKRKLVRIGEVLIALGVLTKEQALEILKEAHLLQGDKPRIGGYELQRLLGKGAMGTVYLARQISMDRSVALKLLPRKLSQDPMFVKRFMREARTCAQLNHPNIIAAIDVGESNGYQYFAMEFVNGEALDDVLKKAQYLEEERALEIAVQVVQGLEHAAGAGIIHRDIKPANLMVCKDHTIKIADMGLAIVCDSETSAHLTAIGTAVGTPYYMAPEQVEGRPDLDFRVDIYALGATLFEVVTGAKPFDGANVPAIMAKRLYEDPPLACDVRPTVSVELSAVIAKMMARDPARRYQDFKSLLADLHSVASQQSPSCMGLIAAEGRSEGAGQNKRHRRRRQPKSAAAISKKVYAVYVAFAVIGVTMLFTVRFIVVNRHALKGPRHPLPVYEDKSLWQPPAAVDKTPGDLARRSWLHASSVHALYLNSKYKSGEDLAEVIEYYNRLARKYPESAYAKQAQTRLQLLEKK